tara:strand:+ start:726 stop:923 length:198 start_codon:yes stop_codon:yes gene_type:complete
MFMTTKVTFAQRVKISVLAGAYEVYDTYKQLTNGSMEEYVNKLNKVEAFKEEAEKPVEKKKLGFC